MLALYISLSVHHARSLYIYIFMRSPFKLAIFFSSRRRSEALIVWAAEQSIEEEKDSRPEIMH